MSGERFTGFESLFVFGCGSCHNDFTCELMLFSEPKQFGMWPSCVQTSPLCLTHFFLDADLPAAPVLLVLY